MRDYIRPMKITTRVISPLKHFPPKRFPTKSACAFFSRHFTGRKPFFSSPLLLPLTSSVAQGNPKNRIESDMEEAKSKPRKRKDLSEAAAIRSSRQRLNGSGVVNGRFSAPVKDLRVHRIFSPGGLDELDDCTVAEKVFGSDVVGSVGQNGVSEQLEALQECVQATPPEEVLAKSKILDLSKKVYVSPSKGSDRQVVGRRSPGSKNLKPCSRTKLFGNPSSFSYRRLLPYLMDITKGALKSLEMKPQLPTNALNSAVETSLLTLEPKVCDRTDLSPLPRGLRPSKISEPIICAENTADTKVPLNYCLTDQEASVSSIAYDLSYRQTDVSVNKNNKLSQSMAGKVVEVLCGMDGCRKGKDVLDIVPSKAMNDLNSIDSVTQHSPDENRSDKMDVLEDDLVCKSKGLGDVPVVKTIDDKYDEPKSNICENNATEVVQETPLDDRVSSCKDVQGSVRCVLKSAGPNKRNEDDKQVVSEVSGSFSVEAISGSNSDEAPTQLSSGENRSEQSNALGNFLSYKHLHLSDTHDARETAVNFDKPRSTICSQSNAELVHSTPVIKEDGGRKDAVQSVSKLEKSLDDSVIINTDNSACEQVITDNKQSPSFERKLNLKPRRLKRFKNYNSVSYRKLLPYLTEIYEDSVGSSNKGQIKMVAKPAIVGDSIKDGHATVSSTLCPRDSSPISDASCDVKPQMKNFDCVSEQVAESSIESHLGNESKSLNDLQFFSHVQGQPTQGPQSSCGPNYVYNGQCIEKTQCTTSKFKEEDMTRIKNYSDDSNLSDVVLVHPELNSQHRRPFASPTRGIIKKNPKGCRGLCTCLKCASFRLHAEKAFEFSRSQLLDSEEIALELINELSVLRNLLKKSVDADTEETSQVQEACDKAHVIEKHAKARFEQMNHELRIHCQIPNLERPSVSFARHTEERTIQTAHSPS